MWTWTAIDSDTKIVMSWIVGSRDAEAAHALMQDVRSRLKYRVQLSTDQYTLYLKAVDQTFGMDVDYAQLQKIFAASGGGRYSPPECIGCRKFAVTGNPDPKHISTSHVERQNLTMRMSIRRFTRLTNAFSKKVTMHAAAVALHFFYYNFVQIHGTLRVTPAMAAGVTDRAWDASNIIALVKS